MNNLTNINNESLVASTDIAGVPARFFPPSLEQGDNYLATSALKRFEGMLLLRNQGQPVSDKNFEKELVKLRPYIQHEIGTEKDTVKMLPNGVPSERTLHLKPTLF